MLHCAQARLSLGAPRHRRRGISLGSETQAGGVAALIQALCYVCGFVMMATFLNPGNTDGWNQLQKLEFVLAHKGIIQLWNVVIYVVFGVALVVLAVSLHHLLKAASPLLMATATSFGLIWAGLVLASGMIANVGLESIGEAYARNATEAVEAWAVIAAVQDGLGGGVEIVGGLWVLLVSIVTLRQRHVFPTHLSLIGMFVGAAGIGTLVPALGVLGAVFGISQILWFLIMGIVLVRSDEVRLERSKATTI